MPISRHIYKSETSAPLFALPCVAVLSEKTRRDALFVQFRPSGLHRNLNDSADHLGKCGVCHISRLRKFFLKPFVGYYNLAGTYPKQLKRYYIFIPADFEVSFSFPDIMYCLGDWWTPGAHFYSQFSPPGIYINPTSSPTTGNMAKYEFKPKRWKYDDPSEE